MQFYLACVTLLTEKVVLDCDPRSDGKALNITADFCDYTGCFVSYKYNIPIDDYHPPICIKYILFF